MPSSKFIFIQALLCALSFLLLIQIGLGINSVRFHLSEPLITVAHQLVAAIIVALLASLSCKRRPLSKLIISENVNESLLEACHG